MLKLRVRDGVRGPMEGRTYEEVELNREGEDGGMGGRGEEKGSWVGP